MRPVTIAPMRDDPRLIFQIEEGGKLTLSFAGSTAGNPPVEGLLDIKLDDPSPEVLLDQVRNLQSPTGIIKVELPGEEVVRKVTVSTSAPQAVPRAA